MRNKNFSISQEISLELKFIEATSNPPEIILLTLIFGWEIFYLPLCVILWNIYWSLNMIQKILNNISFKFLTSYSLHLHWKGSVRKVWISQPFFRLFKSIETKREEKKVSISLLYFSEKFNSHSFLYNMKVKRM